MCSVSLTVPFISDFVKYKHRGVAYGYMGCLIATALGVIMTMIDFDVEKRIDKKWFFVFTSTFGLVSAFIFCSFFKDKQEFKV